MLSALKAELSARVASRIRELYGVEHSPLVEIPPRRELGDLSFPAGLKLAKELRKNPREIGQEIASRLELPEIVREVRVEGAGYLNLYLDRPTVVRRLLEEPIVAETRAGEGKVVVEHTNINPNKAAHIGHLRNAVLGDVLARLLRRLGYPVEVQNYIDDTGVQLADVVVAFVDLLHTSRADIAALPEPFDYYCWDLYSAVGRWYEEDPERQRFRRETLHALESDEGERADIGRLVARRVLRRHLETMARLGVAYDLVTHERHILALDFFALAAERLKATGAIYLETEGKNAGCWVMPLAGSEEFAGLEDADKVIVRSDGTVTYVGKDIAYQLWKLGLLGKDFGYRYWMEMGVWETAAEGAETHPAFGGASRVVNVIDARQSYLQRIVRAGLQALGHVEEAERSVHFAYEMVSLSPATARQFGFVTEGEEGRSLEMSGRRGIGVKADDLLDLLESKSRQEIAARNRELEDEELDRLAREIATAALRLFMVKATTTRVIAFDLDEALSFEGDSGPYVQYAAVRADNIGRKLAERGMAQSVAPAEAAVVPAEHYGDDLWDLVWDVARIAEVMEKAADTLEPSLVARHALDLATKFNAVYHRHPILQEEDEAVRWARLATVGIFRRGLDELAGVMGIPIPEKM
ncbi:MAG TPA: arginine--tRNA ligase [Thermoanaerobaculia bacterium]|nr:arginine--tRNA ligase [Thermoanaerobaculia bacterium]